MRFYNFCTGTEKNCIHGATPSFDTRRDDVSRRNFANSVGMFQATYCDFALGTTQIIISPLWTRYRITGSVTERHGGQSRITSRRQLQNSALPMLFWWVYTIFLLLFFISVTVTVNASIIKVKGSLLLLGNCKIYDAFAFWRMQEILSK